MPEKKSKNIVSKTIKGSKKVIKIGAKTIKSLYEFFKKLNKISNLFLDYLTGKYQNYNDRKKLKEYCNEVIEKIKFYVKSNETKFKKNEEITFELNEKDFENIYNLIDNNKFSDLNDVKNIKKIYEIFISN